MGIGICIDIGLVDINSFLDCGGCWGVSVGRLIDRSRNEGPSSSSCMIEYVDERIESVNRRVFFSDDVIGVFTSLLKVTSGGACSSSGGITSGGGGGGGNGGGDGGSDDGDDGGGGSGSGSYSMAFRPVILMYWAFWAFLEFLAFLAFFTFLAFLACWS